MFPSAPRAIVTIGKGSLAYFYSLTVSCNLFVFIVFSKNTICLFKLKINIFRDLSKYWVVTLKCGLEHKLLPKMFYFYDSGSNIYYDFLKLMYLDYWKELLILHYTFTHSQIIKLLVPDIFIKISSFVEKTSELLVWFHNWVLLSLWKSDCCLK